MTKRIAAAVVCIVLALAVSLGSFIFITVKTNEMLSLIGSIEQTRKTGENAEKYFEELFGLWNGNRRFFAFMLKHADADELERDFIRLSGYYGRKDADELWEAVTECRAALEVMLDGENPVPENIF